MFHNKVLLLPSEVDVLVMRRRGLDPQTNTTLFQDFRVSRRRVELWLRYLQRNHPSFKPGPDGSVRVEVDESRLDQLPADAFVDDQLRSIETFEVNDTDEQGPPEDPNNDQEPTQMTAGCVPNLTNDQSEFELLCRDAQLPSGVNQMVLTAPQVHGTPINEHMGIQIAIDVFPTLFPPGQADFHTAHPKAKVSLKEWAQHLIRYKGGRFA